MLNLFARKVVTSGAGRRAMATVVRTVGREVREVAEEVAETAEAKAPKYRGLFNKPKVRELTPEEERFAEAVEHRAPEAAP